jgi:hypothetical protein
MRRVLGLALVFALVGVASASADPIPAGTYTAQFTGGAVELGNVTFPIDGLAAGTLEVPSTGAANWNVGAITIPDATISSSGLTGTVTTALTGPVTATLDPATGNATASVSGYVTIPITTPLGSTTCHVGNAMSPITISPTTAAGSPWNAATGAISLVDNTFTAGLTCDNGLITSLVTTYTGSTTSPGDNVLRLNGILTLVPTSTSGGTTQQPTTTNQPATGQTTTTTTQCVVPKLKGRKLKKAKAALKKAGCKLGKVKRRAKRKKKAGTVIRQSKKPGTVLPAGSKVNVTVAKKPKLA